VTPEAAAQAPARLRALGDLVVPLALRAACALELADRLAAGPACAADLAAATATEAGALTRLLRLLARCGVFAEPEPGVFALAPMGEFLRGDHPLSLRDGYPLIPPDLIAWGQVGYALRTGRSAFEHAHGCPYYEFLAREPELQARFNRSVEAQNRLMLRPLLAAYDWPARGTVVDIAAGTGTLLAGLLARRPGLQGVLFDLPHVVAEAGDRLEEPGVAGRCRIVAGSYFEAVPAAADLYILKTVLHDWDDERALDILGVVRRAATPGSRLLVIEPLLPPGDTFHMGKLLDLNSLVLVAGPDRGAEDLRALLHTARFTVIRTIRTETLGILEAQPSP
jgi:SAM-dependent methyltransferase